MLLPVLRMQPGGTLGNCPRWVLAGHSMMRPEMSVSERVPWGHGPLMLALLRSAAHPNGPVAGRVDLGTAGQRYLSVARYLQGVIHAWVQGDDAGIAAALRACNRRGFHVDRGGLAHGQADDHGDVLVAAAGIGDQGLDVVVDASVDQRLAGPRSRRPPGPDRRSRSCGSRRVPRWSWGSPGTRPSRIGMTKANSTAVAPASFIRQARQSLPQISFDPVPRVLVPRFLCAFIWAPP